jgi:hypothetical protein
MAMQKCWAIVQENFKAELSDLTEMTQKEQNLCFTRVSLSNGCQALALEHYW